MALYGIPFLVAFKLLLKKRGKKSYAYWGFKSFRLYCTFVLYLFSIRKDSAPKNGHGSFVSVSHYGVLFPLRTK